MNIDLNPTDMAITVNALNSQSGRDREKARLMRMAVSDADKLDFDYHPNLILAEAFDAQALRATDLIERLVTEAVKGQPQSKPEKYDA
ncbi:MAG: hypothetical protein V3S37_02145 [Dehalococcoidia bacterium]